MWEFSGYDLSRAGIANGTMASAVPLADNARQQCARAGIRSAVTGMPSVTKRRIASVQAVDQCVPVTVVGRLCGIRRAERDI